MAPTDALTSLPTMMPTSLPTKSPTGSQTGSPTGVPTRPVTFPPHTHNDDDDPLLTTGEIIGIVIGSVAVVILSGVIGYLIGNNNN